jgi:hypothetical protein
LLGLLWLANNGSLKIPHPTSANRHNHVILAPTPTAFKYQPWQRITALRSNLRHREEESIGACTGEGINGDQLSAAAQ